MFRRHQAEFKYSSLEILKLSTPPDVKKLDSIYFFFARRLRWHISFVRGPYLCASRGAYLTSPGLLLAPAPEWLQPFSQPHGTSKDRVAEPCVNHLSSAQAPCSFSSISGICAAEPWSKGISPAFHTP